VVIGNKGLEVPKIKRKSLSVPNELEGETCFGRGFQSHCDVGSRINWAFLQAIAWPGHEALDASDLERPFWKKRDHTKFGDLVEMTRRVITSTMGVSEVYVLFDPYMNEEEERPEILPWVCPEGSETKQKWVRSRCQHAFIDHGSLWIEKPDNLRIFDSENRLRKFLFDKGSRIEERSD
jgi:hypothetical protein